MPWFASSGATRSASTRAAPISPADRSAKPGSPRIGEGSVRSSLGDDVLERRPREYREDSVVQGEEQEEAATLGRGRTAHATHEGGDRQRQEQRGEEKLPGAPRRGHRRHERPDGADPDVRKEHPGERRRGARRGGHE